MRVSNGRADFFRLLLHNQQCKTDIMVRHPQLFEFLIRAYCEEDAEIRRACEKYDFPLCA